VLIYALYPTTGKKFLKWKYNQEEIPPEVQPKTMEEAIREEKLVEKARKGQVMEIPEKRENMETYNVYVNDEFVRVELEMVGGEPQVASVSQPSAQPVQPQPAPAQQPAAAPTGEVSPDAMAIRAPMPGMIISYEVSVGDMVKNGDALLVFEAMKMESTIVSPVNGTVQKILKKAGDTADNGEALMMIG